MKKKDVVGKVVVLKILSKMWSQKWSFWAIFVVGWRKFRWSVCTGRLKAHSAAGVLRLAINIQGAAKLRKHLGVINN